MALLPASRLWAGKIWGNEPSMFNEGEKALPGMGRTRGWLSAGGRI